MRKSAIIASLIFLLGSASLSNPLFDGADPDILFAGGLYWLYPTSQGKHKFDRLWVYSSADLKDWTLHGPILNIKDISWIADDSAPRHELWAPGIISRNNKFYLFYSVGPQNPTPSRIGVALSDKPDGKFVDSGKALITGSAEFEAIDPMVFQDPRSGNYFLYCGGSAASKLHVYQLKPDLVSVEKEIAVDTPKNFTEGSFMHVHNGKYYLSYSHGSWNTDNYCVCYAMSDSATGPWNYQGKILQTNSKHAGPGHHAFFQNKASGQWYIVYHRWENARSTGKMPEARSIAIERIQYDKNGKIMPVRMTVHKS